MYMFSNMVSRDLEEEESFLLPSSLMIPLLHPQAAILNPTHQNSIHHLFSHRKKEFSLKKKENWSWPKRENGIPSIPARPS